MNMTTPLVLTGVNVTLAPLELRHAEDLYEAGRFPDIWGLTQGRIQSLEDAKEYVSKALEQKNAFPFVIVEQKTQKAVGSTRFYDISIPNKSLEIGSTWLTPAMWRTSINTEAKYLLLKYCFETAGAIRVQLKTDSRNVRSQKAIERLGAVKEGILRNHMILPDGYVRDTIYYSILDREWPAVKARLEGFLKSYID
ncbi:MULTISPECIES: GNAT family N-acetyltransferase [Brevibacillus]|uniref:GNAT family N-acetyltransferase n=1 Tax=Brevibacillus TaxID=55080 RepID=UPI000EE71DBB|nr:MULTISPECIES: GNAT family protein [Brevibacillus]MBU8711901.1 GNAT family N-acetyltransferase [Brevibacillus parabrevis]UED71210.1 GNAT family N-acetyltransferase [Brevibacillus sp. HD3.3A]WDV97435.1 GNAT family protein [Brevibacillus parabrevis]HBZ83426.1 GNAT family N-acetyltransferase [Brevibacillus sp.]